MQSASYRQEINHALHNRSGTSGSLAGLVTSFTAGGLLHILLVAAVVLVVYQLVAGRRGL